MKSVRPIRKMLQPWASLAALLVIVGSPAGIAQTSVQVPMLSNAQYSGRAGDPEQGQHVAEAKCAACHGAHGNSPDQRYPKLSGQNPAYLYGQLWAFKNGARRSGVMSQVVAGLSDADMANAASFYARQVRNADPVKDSGLLALGERIFFGGMPSCAMCHGSPGQGRMPMMGMMGMMGHGMMGMRMANVPNLNGQHAFYIIDQLNRFAAGQRQGTVMNRIAAALSGTDKRAVAEFLSSSP